jgi:hypothetical protein
MTLSPFDPLLNNRLFRQLGASLERSQHRRNIEDNFQAHS